MSNAFASTVFLFRNTDKVKNGDIGRAPVVVAQAGSIVNKVSQLDSSIGKTTKTAIDAFEKSSTLGFGSKAVSVAGELVNPLLVAAAGVRVLTSEDKESAIYQETAAMTGMFAAEKAMKKSGIQKFVKSNTDEALELGIRKAGKFLKPLQEASEKSKNKFVKAASFLISGAAFVGASIVGYDTGHKIGKKAIEAKRNLISEKPASIDMDEVKIPPEKTESNQGFSIES